MADSSAGLRSLRLLYIASSGRSGSTILERVLDTAPGVTGISEMQRFWALYNDPERHCGCGAEMAHCPFWRDVLDAFGGASPDQFRHYEDLHLQVTRTRYVYRLWSSRLRSPAFTQALAEYREVTSRLYRATAEVAGASVLVDSSKGAGYGRMLSGIPGIEMSTLNLVRDSRAVANSWANRRQRFGRDPWPVSYSAFHWLTEHALIETLRPSSRAYLRLRYEDFVRAPAASIAEIGRAFSIPVPALSSAAIDLPISHGFAGNHPRKQQGAVELRGDDSWQRQFPLRHAILVTALSWPMLLRHGYPLRYKR